MHGEKSVSQNTGTYLGTRDHRCIIISLADHTSSEEISHQIMGAALTVSMVLEANRPFCPAHTVRAQRKELSYI